MGNDMRSVEGFIKQSAVLVAAFNAWAKNFGVVNVPGGNRAEFVLAAPDHICFKCRTGPEYQHMKRMLEVSTEGFLHESMISGRLISIIELSKPIVTNLGDIYVVELSDQKPNGTQIGGFDHIEVYPLESLTLDEFANKLNLRGAKFDRIERPHHTTYDMVLPGTNFKVRLEPEALITKIKRDEL